MTAVKQIMTANEITTYLKIIMTAYKKNMTVK